MKILILGGDGYLGWPTSLYFSARDHDVFILDNFVKKKIELENGVKNLIHQLPLAERVKLWNSNNKKKIKSYTCDLLNHRLLYDILDEVKPEVIIHYAEQPSAPYSMIGREACIFTQHNNVIGNLNLLFGMKKYCPDAHLIKLGTMGEYGTPNIDIEEGWLDIVHNGRKDRLLYPKKPGSFYHLSKVHDSNNIEFACRIWDLKCTDLNQGVVYGISTKEIGNEEGLATSFHYDEIFGTVINRFVTQASLGLDLTVYGEGTQERGYLNINDTMRCVELSALNPPKKGEFRVFNQYTETFSINDIAKKVLDASKELSINIEAKKIENPRIEQQNHYYNPTNKSLINLGLKHIELNNSLLKDLINKIKNYSNNVIRDTLSPKIKWKK